MIIAVTYTERVNRQLSLVWGVHPVMGKKAGSTDEMMDIAIESSRKSGLCQRGSRVIITAGVPINESGTTNLMKIHVIGDVVAKGQGIGKSSAFGKAVFARNAEEAMEKVEENDILVTYATDRDMMPAIEKASGIVTEEGGLTSHAAVVGLSLGKPVVVGVENVYEQLTDGKEITIDASNGDIYEGHASVL